MGDDPNDELDTLLGVPGRPPADDEADPIEDDCGS